MLICRRDARPWSLDFYRISAPTECMGRKGELSGVAWQFSVPHMSNMAVVNFCQARENSLSSASAKRCEEWQYMILIAIGTCAQKTMRTRM